MNKAAETANETAGDSGERAAADAETAAAAAQPADESNPAQGAAATGGDAGGDQAADPAAPRSVSSGSETAEPNAGAGTTSAVPADQTVRTEDAEAPTADASAFEPPSESGGTGAPKHVDAGARVDAPIDAPAEGNGPGQTETESDQTQPVQTQPVQSQSATHDPTVTAQPGLRSGPAMRRPAVLPNLRDYEQDPGVAAANSTEPETSPAIESTAADSAAEPATGPETALATDAAAEPATGPETAADAKAGPAPVPARAAGESADFDGSAPRTAMLSIRPPEDEAGRRAAAREEIANSKPLLPRVLQSLLAVFYPFILLVLAIRTVTSSLFVWIEYHRPGFPPDMYGFTTDDRMTYGSYTVDYLLNWTGPRYLGSLVTPQGNPLFTAGEVSHMADVKSVIVTAFAGAVVLAIFYIIAIIYLARRYRGGVRRGLFAGAVATLAIIIALGVLASLGWEKFFTTFHQLFFSKGTWTFYLDDTLIRLFPSQFWIDAGITIGGVTFVVSLVTLILTWPTTARRRRSFTAQQALKARRAGAGA